MIYALLTSVGDEKIISVTLSNSNAYVPYEKGTRIVFNDGFFVEVKETIDEIYAKAQKLS